MVTQASEALQPEQRWQGAGDEQGIVEMMVEKGPLAAPGGSEEEAIQCVKGAADDEDGIRQVAKAGDHAFNTNRTRYPQPYRKRGRF
jgi:hypothetical protein